VRNWHRLGVIAALLLSALAAAAAPAWAFDSTQYQATAKHDGRVQEPGLAPPFTRAWSIRMDHPGYPVIAGGMAFVVDRDGDDAGTKVRAVDLASGTVVWKKPIGGSYNWAALTFDADRLFVISNAGVLSAFDAATGVKIWAVALPGQYFFTAPPTASDGVVYVNGSGSGGTLYAVSEADGSVLWTASVVNGDASAPTLSATRVFVQFACTFTQSFDRSSGNERWRYDTGCSGGGGATSVLHNSLLYTRDNGDNRILNAWTGQLVDTYATRAIPAFDGPSMYALAGSRIRAIDLSSGNIRWSRAYDGHLVSNPLVVNHWVIEASSLGRVIAYRKSTGALVWHGRVGEVGPSAEGQVYEPITGLAAGNGFLLVPTTTRLVGFRSAGP
jgi:outer membrane protein assembly factor BamB